MNFLKWDFLDEPLYRWFILIIALTIFMALWGTVLQYMRKGI